MEKLDVMQVEKHICLLAAEEMRTALPKYKILHIFRGSEHPSDIHLYYVVGQKESGMYASWLYNVSTGTFNNGHYDFDSHIECIKDVINNRINYL